MIFGHAQIDSEEYVWHPDQLYMFGPTDNDHVGITMRTWDLIQYGDGDIWSSDHGWNSGN